jgi:hypothetical protein
MRKTRFPRMVVVMVLVGAACGPRGTSQLLVAADPPECETYADQLARCLGPGPSADDLDNRISLVKRAMAERAAKGPEERAVVVQSCKVGLEHLTRACQSSN